MRAKIVLAIAIAATALLYWPGLSGSFLFDDGANLAQIQRWLNGDASLYQAIFGTSSGMFLRPVSMASFTLNATLTGLDPFHFKLTNLAIHLLCGLLIWLLLRQLLSLDRRLASRADVLAAAVAALWLFHPLNASTVLYTVQRMAQLSTLFALAAVMIYVVARKQLDTGRTLRGGVYLFALFPLLLLAGVLSKENAAVAIGLCLVVEIAYFGTFSRHRAVLGGFFALFLAIPAIAATALLLIAPQRLLGGYEVRDFTVLERILTQFRALMDYLGQLLLPRGPQMGLYTDDFVVSMGLTTPPSTLLAILALLALSVAAVALRKRAPSVFAGWFIFLVAHGVESTILPLELYFEHRNYLPSVGILLAVVAGGALLLDHVPTNMLSPGRLGVFAVGALSLALAFATLGRALTWQSLERLATQGVQHHPKSLRANLDFATVAMQSGDYGAAQEAMLRLASSENPRSRLIAFVGMASLDCLFTGHGNPGDLRRAVENAPPHVTLAEFQAFETLNRILADHECQGLTHRHSAEALRQIADATDKQPDSSGPKWRMRLLAAQAYGRAGMWAASLEQSKLAWQPTADPGVGGMLVQAYLQNSDFDGAEFTLREMRDRSSHRDKTAQLELERVQSAIAEAKAQANNES